MASATGTLVFRGLPEEALRGYELEQRYEWNGNVADRQRARRAFERAVTTGSVFASVTEAPGKQRQVRTFGEVEEIERQKGTVEVTIRSAIQGG